MRLFRTRSAQRTRSSSGSNNDSDKGNDNSDNVRLMESEKSLVVFFL